MLDQEEEGQTEGRAQIINTQPGWVVTCWKLGFSISPGTGGNFCWTKQQLQEKDECVLFVGSFCLWQYVGMHQEDHYHSFVNVALLCNLYSRVQFFKDNYIFNINPVASVTQLFLLSSLKVSLINPVVAEKKLYSFFHYQPTRSKESHDVHLYNGGYSSWKGRPDRKTLKYFINSWKEYCLVDWLKGLFMDIIFSFIMYKAT